jgi:hypothetical protein
VRAPVEARGVELVGYAHVDGRPAFKLALQVVDGRWFLYCGHLWHSGWSIVDVTDPTRPDFLRFLPGPANTWTSQVNVAHGLMVTNLASIPVPYGGDSSQPNEETAFIWDVRGPTAPQRLAQVRFGGTGGHRHFWAGGTYVHMTANVAGFQNYLYVIVDVSEPASPREVGRWWLDGQGPGEEPRPTVAGISLHGPPYVVGDRAYLSYGGAGMVILDISDVTSPRLVSQFRVAPPFHGGLYGAGVHTVRPLPRRGLAVVHGEAHDEGCHDPLDFCGIVDISDETAPRLVSTFPVPRPSPGLRYSSYCDKGGRFGPHNSVMPQGSPFVEDRDDVIYMTWFNAGLRIFDISDARHPAEVAWFVPADPPSRVGPMPANALVTQSEDVIVDTRGFIYVTDKNQGIHILRREE